MKKYDPLISRHDDTHQTSVYLVQQGQASDSYVVYVYEHGREDQQGCELSTSDIVKAVTTWFEWSSKYPACVAIEAINKHEAYRLLEWAASHESTLRELDRKYHCPHKIDNFIRYINKVLDRGFITGFYRDHPDQVYPFALG